MEAASLSYDFRFLGGPNHLYAFKSRFEAGYEVRFKHSGYLVDPEYAEHVYEMVIALVVNPHAPRLPPVDDLMSVTIARIVEHFFATRQRVIVYVCDDSDSRADARRKLFDGWFRRFSEKRYVKLQVPLGIDENGSVYSAEMVARVENPLFGLVYESFKRTVSGIK